MLGDRQIAVECARADVYVALRHGVDPRLNVSERGAADDVWARLAVGRIVHGGSVGKSGVSLIDISGRGSGGDGDCECRGRGSGAGRERLGRQGEDDLPRGDVRRAEVIAGGVGLGRIGIERAGAAGGPEGGCCVGYGPPASGYGPPEQAEIMPPEPASAVGAG